MCTLTWITLGDGYFVAFSRDERRSRAPGSGPRLLERGGVKAIAPIDAEAGGTWILVNELGMTLALLNGYRFQDPKKFRGGDAGVWNSRGELAMNAGEAANVSEVADRLASFELARYRPFELVAFDASGAVSIASWNGSALEQRALNLGDRPLVSSSFDDCGARKARRAEFVRLVPAQSSVHELERFHASHAPSRGPYSPCMHREDAHTVSFSRVQVSADEVELSYQPQSPCAGMASERIAIPRRVVARH